MRGGQREDLTSESRAGGGHSELRARSADPFAHPVIQPNYLSDERDQQVAIDGVRLTRLLLHTPQLMTHWDCDELPPATAASDSELLQFARAYGGTAWHPAGTCRMGPPTAPDSVVDSELRVIGVQGLRVADASIMPMITSGNTGAPTMMIAEKAADMILGKAPPPSELFVADAAALSASPTARAEPDQAPA